MRMARTAWINVNDPEYEHDFGEIAPSRASKNAARKRNNNISGRGFCLYFCMP